LYSQDEERISILPFCYVKASVPKGEVILNRSGEYMPAPNPMREAIPMIRSVYDITIPIEYT
jgi:hypothetical protein